MPSEYKKKGILGLQMYIPLVYSETALPRGVVDVAALIPGCTHIRVPPAENTYINTLKQNKNKLNAWK